MCFYPVSIPTNGAGLNLTGVSYNRVMWLGTVVSCREIVPDPAFFTACMQEAWDELLAAADALPAVPATSSPAKARAKAPGARKPAIVKTPAKAPAVKKAAAPKQQQAGEQACNAQTDRCKQGQTATCSEETCNPGQINLPRTPVLPQGCQASGPV